jgi:acetylornithine deacetylase/succinyl-diaminopimelate desuccinylase-like protein
VSAKQDMGLLDATLQHLQALVGFDTRNPPRVIGTGGLFDYVRAQLPGFEVTVTDYGAGAVTLHAVRGEPKYLFNVHMDTVPDSPDWSADPHLLRVTEDRAVGLGACDIKGAAAALLAVANACDGPLALLLSTDEEANDARCIAGFLAGSHDYQAIIVAEPTKGEAVLAHMIAPSAEVRFGCRPLPTMDPDRLLERFRSLVEPQPAEFSETFRGASLPAGDTATAEHRRLVARDLADELEIPIGNAVDFWTEAALFSAAGYTAFVYGPGDIAQAHSADEWVSLDQLQHYAETLYRIVASGKA